MRLMVTGGAGFIGSNLVKELVKYGHAISVFDNLSTGKKENLVGGVNFYLGDIRDKEYLNYSISQEKPEIIFHLAAQISVSQSVIDPVTDGEINIFGTLNLLKSAVKHEVQKIVFASSAAVYGRPQYLPIDENHIKRPLSGYGITKNTAEQYISIYQNFGVDYTILRLANVYGAGQFAGNEGGVIAIFYDKLINGQVPVIYGNGEQTRDFIYVKDVVSAFMASINRGKAETLNISTGCACSVNQLFAFLKEILGKNIEAKYEDERPGDIRSSVLYNKQAVKVLNWKPLYSLRSGLTDTIDILTK
ncbi:MAG: UDP-glucose 4-epimerase [Candidatus Dichloromethanomonas elyunquensis]|nr:MAG: UDP-glucose 4-epimerase [Candidatus Dichloromethanomonas elyunquensis]